MSKKVVYPILGLFIGFVLWLIIYGETTGENSVVEEAVIGMGFILSAVGALLGFLVSLINQQPKGRTQQQYKKVQSKICPDCLGNMPTLAKKCMHCGTEQVKVSLDKSNLQHDKLCPNCSTTIASWALKCPSCETTL
jgi:ribosomal protein L40E